MFGIPEKYKSLSISNQILDKEELKEVFDYLASSVTPTKAHNNGDGDDGDDSDSLNNKQQNKKKQTIDIPTLKLLFSSLGHGDKITKKSLRILIQRIIFRQKQQQVQEKDEKIEGETVDVKKEKEQATTERNYNDDSKEDKDNGGDDHEDEILEVDFELCWSISQELVSYLIVFF